MRHSFLCRWTGAAALALQMLLPASAQQNSPVQSLPAASPAQTTGPIVVLTSTQYASFQAAFTALAQQGHVAFVAEDQPLHVTLLPRQVPRLNPSGEPLPQMVAEVAAAYDYDAERKGQVFLLRKRYTDPADLPDVTLAECSRSVEVLREVTDAVDPHLFFYQLGREPSIANLLTSLTPEQLEMMRDKSLSVPTVDAMKATEEEIAADIKKHIDLSVQSQGLPISTLTPEQRDAIRQIVLVVGVELPTIGLHPQVVAEAAAKDPSFCRKSGRYGPEFGYDLPTGTAKQKEFTFLSFLRRTTDTIINGARSSTSPDPSAPLLQVKAPPLALSISLTQAVSSLDTRTGFQPKMLVATELAPKHVSLFGAENAPPEAVFQSLADVYGLSVRTRKDKSRLLVWRDVQIPLDYAAMAANVYKAIPEPLRRAVLSNSAREGHGPVTDAGTQGGGYVFTPVTLEASAVRVLRTAVEPRLRTAKDGHVPLSSLGEREKSALAVALTVPQIESLAGISERELPETVTRFDDLCLRGGPSAEDPRKFDLTLVLSEAGSASPHQVLSASGIDYTPNDAVLSSGTR